MANLAYVPSRGRWRVRWRATNRTTKAVLSGSQVFLEKPQAAAVWAEMEAQEAQWRSGQVTATGSIAEAVAAFAKYCRRHSDTTRDLYRSVLDAFVAALPQNVQRIQQLTAAHIEEYLSQLCDAGRVNRTLNCHLTPIKAFSRWLARQYGIANVAANVAMLTQDPPDHRFLTPEEYAKLIAACCPLLHPQASPIWYDRILFLAHTGLRAHEFSQAVRQGRLSAQVAALTLTGKGRRARTIPLNATCRAILARPHIYRPISRDHLYIGIAKLARRAEIPPCGPHALRHWCATQLLLAGVPIVKVAKILGHSVKVCETTYAHILPQDLAHVTDVLDGPPNAT